MFGRRRPAGAKLPQGRPEDAALAAAEVPPVSFLVVGCMKCGTTTLREALVQHGDVHLPEQELHFFGNHERYLSVWQGGRIDPAALEEHYGRHYRTDRAVLGGKTPNYLVSSLTVERIQRFHPDARLVVMVRDPVARAESHWNHLLRQVRSGRVPAQQVAATFGEQALRDQRELEDARRPDLEVRHTNVLYRGLYARQVRRLHHFFPAERVFVGVMEEMVTAPAEFFAALHAFLGIEPRPVTLPAPRAPDADAPRERLSDAERLFLASFYREANDDLATLLGRALPWRA